MLPYDPVPRTSCRKTDRLRPLPSNADRCRRFREPRLAHRQPKRREEPAQETAARRRTGLIRAGLMPTAPRLNDAEDRRAPARVRSAASHDRTDPRAVPFHGSGAPWPAYRCDCWRAARHSAPTHRSGTPCHTSAWGVSDAHRRRVRPPDRPRCRPEPQDARVPQWTATSSLAFLPPRLLASWLSGRPTMHDAGRLPPATPAQWQASPARVRIARVRWHRGHRARTPAPASAIGRAIGSARVREWSADGLGTWTEGNRTWVSLGVPEALTRENDSQPGLRVTYPRHLPGPVEERPRPYRAPASSSRSFT